MLVQVMGIGFEKKTVMCSFSKLKCVQCYCKIGSWILKPVRLAARTVSMDQLLQLLAGSSIPPGREKFFSLLLNWCSKPETYRQNKCYKLSAK